MSLDGFITGAGGDMSWALEHFGPNPEIDDLLPQIGALLVGANTFRGDDPYQGVEDREGKYAGGGWNGPQFVLTHNPPDDVPSDTTFVTDLETGIAKASAAAGDGYVNVLGADVAHQCLEAGTLDEIFLCIAPVLLGDGVRLFHQPGGANIKLETLSSTPLPHVTNMRMSVRR
jgi:dihydrofolate reductase